MEVEGYPSREVYWLLPGSFSYPSVQCETGEKTTVLHLQPNVAVYVPHIVRHAGVLAAPGQWGEGIHVRHHAAILYSLPHGGGRDYASSIRCHPIDRYVQSLIF